MVIAAVSLSCTAPHDHDEPLQSLSGHATASIRSLAEYFGDVACVCGRGGAGGCSQDRSATHTHTTILLQLLWPQSYNRINSRAFVGMLQLAEGQGAARSLLNVEEGHWRTIQCGYVEASPAPFEMLPYCSFLLVSELYTWLHPGRRRSA